MLDYHCTVTAEKHATLEFLWALNNCRKHDMVKSVTKISDDDAICLICEAGMSGQHIPKKEMKRKCSCLCAPTHHYRKKLCGLYVCMCVSA